MNAHQQNHIKAIKLRKNRDQLGINTFPRIEGLIQEMNITIMNKTHHQCLMKKLS